MDYCDGWMPIGRPGEQNDLAEGLGKLRALCERFGRCFDSLELAVIGLPPSKDLAKRLLRIGFKHLILASRLATLNRQWMTSTPARSLQESLARLEYKREGPCITTQSAGDPLVRERSSIPDGYSSGPPWPQVLARIGSPGHHFRAGWCSPCTLSPERWSRTLSPP